jgi:ATP-binding cassette, subfamily A (ABC1), member 3
MVQGVGVITYWVSNYVMDIIKYFIFAASGIGLIKAFKLDTLSTQPVFEHICILFGLNGLSMISFTYFFNFLFKDFGSAQTWIFLLYILSGTILTTLIYVMRLFDTTRKYALGLNYALKLFPPYLFGCTILESANSKVFALNDGRSTVDINLYDWSENG